MKKALKKQAKKSAKSRQKKGKTGVKKLGNNTS
jgi:hypothetical protein